MSMSQKQAIINAVLSFYPNYEMGGEVTLKSILTKESKETIRKTLFEGFRAGKISFESKAELLANDSYLNKYVSSLLDNWVRKLPDFNNGGIYAIKNPGSRSGSSDLQVKNMRALLKKPGLTAEQKVEIQAAIDSRLVEIKPESKVEIDVNQIPENLRHLVTTK